jgi:hypothetical protein
VDELDFEEGIKEAYAWALKSFLLFIILDTLIILFLKFKIHKFASFSFSD